MEMNIGVGGQFHLECRDKEGKLKWEDTADNAVVNPGLILILNTTFAGATVVDPWYVGLMATSPTVASADTASVHAGWTEFTSYTGNRQTFVDARSGLSVSNSASAATFVVTTAGTVGGAFLQSTALSSLGTLLCGAALTGSNRSVADLDTVNLTYTFTIASV